MRKSSSVVCLERKIIPASLCEIKAVAEEGSGFVEGYASVFDNVDHGADIVQKGAFTKTLQEGLPKKAIKLVDSHLVFQEGTGAIIGLVEKAYEDSRGLQFKGRFSSVGRAQDVRTKIQEGILNSVSFGFKVFKEAPGKIGEKSVRYLKELGLYEISIVPWGMNPLAEVTGIKGVQAVQEFKTADAGFGWDGTAAKKRIQEWINTDESGDTDSGPAEWDAEDWDEYAKCFLYCSEAGSTKLADYKFPVVDIIKGEPQYVLKAASAALSAVRGGHGLSRSNSDWWGDRAKIEAEIAKIYQKFGKTIPEKGMEMSDVQLKEYGYNGGYYESPTSTLSQTDPTLYGVYSDFTNHLAAAADKMKHVKNIAEAHGVLNTDYAASSGDSSAMTGKSEAERNIEKKKLETKTIESKANLAAHASMLGDQAMQHLDAAGKHVQKIVKHLSNRKADDLEDVGTKALLESLSFFVKGDAEGGAAQEPENLFHSLLHDMKAV